MSLTAPPLASFPPSSCFGTSARGFRGVQATRHRATILSGCIHRLTMNRRRLFRIAALAGLLPLALPAEDWPQFRGPTGNGVAQEDEAPLHWGPAQNVRWKAALPGPGNSSPIASHGRVFVTCAEDAGKKRNLYCFDRRTGKDLWVRNEILCSMLTRLVACDPKTGALLWFCEGLAEEKADLVY